MTARAAEPLDNLFNPQRLAVIGVSPRKTNLARGIVENLLTMGFTGEIYPVGRSGGVVFGMKIYRNVSDVPAPLDAAAILTPAHTLPDILEQCGRHGVKFAYVQSAGFSEYGRKGALLADRAAQIAQDYGMRFVGPNGIGVINMDNGLCVPFPTMPQMFKGHVSVLSQSGGVGISYIQEFLKEHVGMAKFASLGNKLDVDEVDLLPVLLRDEQTHTICVYLEGFSRGREFFLEMRKARKPIIVHKSNIGRAAQKIAASHTSAMVSDDAVVDAAIKQAGALRCDEINQMIDAAKALSLPAMKGNRLAIISRSGGHAIIAADHCEKFGFELPPFPREVIANAEEKLRAKVIKLDNPMDLGDLYDLDAYKHILADVVSRPQFDAICFLFTYISRYDPRIPEEMISFLAELNRKHNKPVAMGLISWHSEARRLKEMFDFPIFTTPEEAVRALAISRDNHVNLQQRCGAYRVPKIKGRDLERVDAIRESTRGQASLNRQALEVLEAYAIPAIRGKLATSVGGAVKAAREIGLPVALKVESPDVTHKSDCGGVLLDLRTVAEVREGWDKMMAAINTAYPRAQIRGALVQKYADQGLELILGFKQDNDFGPIVMLGWGGIYTEVLGDTVLRVAPFDRAEARSMVEQLRGSKILHGTRGRGPSDLAALEQTLVKLSILAAEQPWISEMDINPLRVYPKGKGVLAVDARIIPVA
ncbi:MAG: acetate--CoA ligase family protein [Candidatus Alcyoniella australis]|nr:acetate--CoA ligase family protein [Candidatus Alcyoniella australis]